MPLPAIVERVLREFKRYTGDGLPNEPAAAPLPVGDPSSGVYNPKKSELRAMFGAVIDEAQASADAAAQALADSLAMIVPDNAVTTPKLALHAVTADKIAAGAKIDGDMMENLKLVASVASNALTIAIKTKAGTDPSAADPVAVAFRSATATDGGYEIRTITAALSMTVSAGSTLGMLLDQRAHVNVGLIDNAGTVELCVSGVVNPMDESAPVSTTAVGTTGTADSRRTLYSTTARNSVALRRVGYVAIQLDATTLGYWSNSPTRIVVEPHAGLRPLWNSRLITPQRFGARAETGFQNQGPLLAFFDACQDYIGEIPPGIYESDAGWLYIRSNSKIYGYGATIKIPDGAGSSRRGLSLAGTSLTSGIADTIIEGLTVDGNRAGRPGVASAAALFYAFGTSRVHLRNCRAINAPTDQDGFYLGGDSGVSTVAQECTLEHCEAISNGRNGLSLVGVSQSRIIGGVFNSTTGMSPGCGIDMEPDGANSSLTDVTLDQVSCIGNANHGINIHGSNIQQCAIIHPYVYGNTHSGIYGPGAGGGCTVHWVRGAANGDNLLGNSLVDSQ